LFLVLADAVRLLEENISTMKKNTKKVIEKGTINKEHDYET